MEMDSAAAAFVRVVSYGRPATAIETSTANGYGYANYLRLDSSNVRAVDSWNLTNLRAPDS